MAIPTKAKNVLLLPVTDGGVTQPFNMPGFPTYDKSKNKHNGLDIGWNTVQYCDILACQDGKVVQVITNDVSGSRGNGVVLQHDYADGTHRWTGYIHLRNTPTVKVGQVVKQGDVIGIRGGSPYINGKQKYGTHLHLYVTSVTKAAYTWNTLLDSVIDPFPLLYRGKNIQYNKLVNVLKDLPYLEDAIPEVVDPVPRDPLVNQLSEATDCLRVRMTPSLKGTIIGYLEQNKFYNWYEVHNADGYDWYRIAENQWSAKTSTMTIYPAKSEIEILEEEIERLEKENKELEIEKENLESKLEEANKEQKELEKEKARLEEDLELAEKEQKELEKKNTTLQKENKEITEVNEVLNTKIGDAVKVLTK